MQFYTLPTILEGAKDKGVKSEGGKLQLTPPYLEFYTLGFTPSQRCKKKRGCKIENMYPKMQFYTLTPSEGCKIKV